MSDYTPHQFDKAEMILQNFLSLHDLFMNDELGMSAYNFAYDDVIVAIARGIEDV